MEIPACKLQKETGNRPLSPFAQWHFPAMGQAPQFPPQEDFPCFRSLRSFTTIAATIAINPIVTTIDPAFSAKKKKKKNKPLKPSGSAG